MNMTEHPTHATPCVEERGHHMHRRCRTGPTGRNKTWTLIADTCSDCGLVQPIKRPLTHEQKDWVRRINRRAHRIT